MRYRAALLGLVLLAAGCGGSGGGTTTTTAVKPPKLTKGKLTVVVKGQNPRPKANANWRYGVKAVDSSGKEVSGKITVEIVDPLGNAHVATYANTKKPVRNFPFKGTFHDSLTFPKQSIGFPLTVRAQVVSGQAKGTGTYGVKVK